eukprot:6179561-Pleurochrysis_carterae.AAC.1
MIDPIENACKFSAEVDAVYVSNPISGKMVSWWVAITVVHECARACASVLRRVALFLLWDRTRGSVGCALFGFLRLCVSVCQRGNVDLEKRKRRTGEAQT